MRQLPVRAAYQASLAMQQGVLAHAEMALALARACTPGGSWTRPNQAGELHWQIVLMSQLFDPHTRRGTAVARLWDGRRRPETAFGT